MKKNSAFTLIELLVVITIIGILSTVGFTTYTAVTKSGRDVLRKTNIEQIRSALEIYKAQKGSYPIVAAGVPPVCGAAAIAALGLDTTYINPFPNDPSSNRQYCYNYNMAAPGTDYKVCAALENPVPVGINYGVTLCSGGDCIIGSAGTCNYRAFSP